MDNKPHNHLKDYGIYKQRTEVSERALAKDAFAFFRCRYALTGQVNFLIHGTRRNMKVRN